MKRIHAVVSGRVQGVGYRMATGKKAYEFGVTGWVQNRPDGTVEFEAEGSREAVDALVMWAWKGPWTARVDHVQVTVIEPLLGPIKEPRFEVRR